MSRSRHIVWVLIPLFLLLVGCFYWFQWRPTQVRKECYLKTFGRISLWVEENEKGNKEWASGKEWMDKPQRRGGKPNWGWWYPTPKNSKVVEYWFARCLNKNGIKVNFPH